MSDGSIEVLVTALRGWLDALAIRAAHFVADSMVGLVIRDLALRGPERVLSCTLIAKTGLGTKTDADYINGVVTADSHKLLKSYLERLFADGSRVTHQLIVDLLKCKLLDEVGSALRLLVAKFVFDGQQLWVFRDRLAELNVPLFVVWGARDQILPARHAVGLSHTERFRSLTTARTWY